MGKTYLITGASSEVGINLIRALYTKEDIFIAHYNNNSSRLEELILELGDNIKLHKSNFMDENDVDRFVKEIHTTYKGITHIVHLPAKNIEYKKFTKIEWIEFQNEIDIQLRSIVKITSKFIGGMAKNNDGKIVCLLTSGVMNVPPKYLSSYITTKYALLGFMKSLAAEYAEKHICINSVAPSMMETTFINNIPDIAVKLSSKNNPMKRNAKVEDVIPIIAMLLSDSNKFVTGTCISVAGGEIF